MGCWPSDRRRSGAAAAPRVIKRPRSGDPGGMAIRRIFGTLSPLAFTLAAATAARPALAFEGAVTVGAGRPVSTGKTDYGWDVALAAALGGRVHQAVSLHARAQLPLLDFEDNGDLGGRHLQLGGAGLFHPLTGRAGPDVFVGPTLGWFRGDASGETLGVDYGGHVWGWHAGALLGVLFPLSRGLSLGASLEYARLFPQEACGQAFGFRDCDSDPSGQPKGFVTLGLMLGF